MSKSAYLEDAILDHMLGGPDFARPATVYVGLYTAAPSEPDGTGGTEVAGNGYARVSVTNDATNFPAAASGAKSNGNVITFPQATGGDWGTVVAFGIFDAPTAGNLLFFGTLGTSKSIQDGDTGRFPVGDLTLNEN